MDHSCHQRSSTLFSAGPGMLEARKIHRRAVLANSQDSYLLCMEPTTNASERLQNRAGYMVHRATFQDEVASASDDSSYIYLAESRAAAESPTARSWASVFWRRAHRHWYYLSWACSHRRQVRLDAVRALADLRHLTDAQFREIAQACDVRTGVGLARTASADMRFFLPPPPVPAHLSQVECDREGGPVVEEPWHGSVETELDLALQALVRHCSVAEHRHRLVHAGLLPLLQRLLLEHPDDVRLHSLAAQALANLSLEPDLHQVLFRSGWVGILARWLRNPETLLSFPASRALANMDTDSSWPMGYGDGVYLLHPEYRLQVAFQAFGELTKVVLGHPR
ncbi:hypothetical protein HPB47_021999 [Ixodes persulcatus]|uniref:Uncharacterized protein n=1 Tax=Ixodes persulcatus TaxID=34615 RepID=A0AC60QCS8_IXOPE|nr:hypothetical protein HPB47_021999 [Ixodes persulcatus]